MPGKKAVVKKSVYSSLLVFFLLGAFSPTFPQESSLVPSEVYRDASRCVLSARYHDAETLLDAYIRSNPDEPSGPLFKAAVLQYACTDYEDFSREDEFNALLDSTEKLAKQKLRDNADDLWAQYYYHAAESLRGVRAASTGKFIRGILKGRTSAKGMEKIVDADSTFYDAYVIRGSYRFWKSIAVNDLSWLPFINDERENAFREVKTGISRGKLNGALSNTVLLEMLLAHDQKQAVELGEKMLGEYPSCRLFAWQLGEAYKKMQSYDDAERIFIEIARSMVSDENDDGSGELRCWWKLAVLSKSVGKTEKCLYYCHKVIELGSLKSVAARQKKRIDAAEKLIREVQQQ